MQYDKDLQCINVKNTVEADNLLWNIKNLILVVYRHDFKSPEKVIIGKVFPFLPVSSQMRFKASLLNPCGV